MSKRTRSSRGWAAACVLAVLATVAGWQPVAAQAAPSLRCDERYTITKPPPKKSDLPGFNGRTETPNPAGNRRTYDYENPGENARGISLPDDPDDLIPYGTDTSRYPSGTKEHVYAAWNRYVERKRSEGKPQLDFGKWLNRYVPNQGNDARGKAYEKLVAEDLGLGGQDWLCQDNIPGSDKTRKYDAINHNLKIAYEFKSGRTFDVGQLVKDRENAAKSGYKLVYIFGDKPTAKTVRELKAAGIDIHRMSATGVVTNRAAPVRGAPGSQIMNPRPNVPSGGALNDLAAGSGRSKAEARLIADADDDLARQSPRPDARLRRPGGIDFSTMELRYVSDQASNGFEYAFEAGDVVEEEDDPSFGGLENAQLSSDSLFTWLALPNSSFWVNLNPDQPDKVIDPALGKTDAGRVLLEADFALKKAHAELLDPATELGDKFWDAVHFDSVETYPCLPLRLWIDAKPATVREDGGKLYILDAPLKASAEYMTTTTLPDGATPCKQSEEVAKQNVAEYNRLIQPALEQKINTEPEFADLRRVYMSRVAAEWVKQRDAKKAGAFHAIIGSNDIGRWPARTKWSAQEIWQRYYKSFKEGEYQYTREVTRGGQTLTLEFALGGVDFGKAPRTEMPAKTFTATHPALPATVKESVYEPVAYAKAGDTTELSWLGGDAIEKRDTGGTKPPTSPVAQPPAGSGDGSDGGAGGGSGSDEPGLPITGTNVAAIAAVGALLLGGGAVLLIWQRRRGRSFEA
ncbi:LPXTG cell wall anchor domain-containing protein [Actinoplanes sp. CA-030573]|uniref:LPXTG cell wall anchor domain-containing protein n=1 Tax=Actinoplanes sp. CA-030573 TaxID=3239898 RepID=UPI003D93772E